jgi:isoquinoline 1-oxidoreductase subunit alpha
MPHLTINGKAHEVDVDPDTPLLWVIREWIGMTGTKAAALRNAALCTVMNHNLRLA